jgi:hypothetical protein
MLSYAVSLRGGYRLIAIDSCTYTPDVTSSGRTSAMRISPGLLDWILDETEAAALRGETVIGMAHGTIVEHFDLEKILSKNSTVIDNERISHELADTGMHYVFTGHLHSNDISKAVSANNETIFDIETGALCSFPNTYREVSFTKGLVQGHVNCRLENVDCDDQVLVDVSGVSEKYGIIQRPFKENYCMPTLHGGSIDDGIRNDPLKYFENAHLLRATEALHKALPHGIAGFLRDNGIDIGEELTKNSTALKSALKGYNLTPDAFAQFLGAVVARVDDKYIDNTEHTEELILAVVERFADFEIVEGNPDTAFGKIALLAFEYNAVGNENPDNNPEITASVNALRTQKGADRVVHELLDIIINDLLFDDILPSISLNELDMLLPADLMVKLRSVAGDDLSVGGVLDIIFGNAADRLNRLPFINIGDSRDLIMATVYTAGVYFINTQGRLKLGNALADLIVSFTTDENPHKLGDYDTTLEYKGKVAVVPTVENYRLPADITVLKGVAQGDVVIKWNTMLGLEGTDIEITPLPAGAVITRASERIDKAVPAIDFGFFAFNRSIPLVSHTVTISGLETGIAYTFSVGDSARGLMSEDQTLTIGTDGEVRLNSGLETGAPYTFSVGDSARGLMSEDQTLTIGTDGEVRLNSGNGNDFFTRLVVFYSAVAGVLQSLKTILMFIT